jgi:TolB protein
MLRIAVLVIAVLVVPAARASAELILSVSTRTGNPDIFVIDPVTGDALNLTKHKAQDVSPALSADGKRIAFSSDRNRNEENKVFDIFVMDEDGGNLRQLTKDTGVNGTPCWSPDGKKIAFVRYLPEGGPQVFVMNADGSEQASITPGRTGYDPAWSPDGKRIAHTSFVNSHGFHLWIMDADADFIDQHLEIFTCDADGANPTQLTRLGKTSTFPAWSPDGKSILFQHALNANTGPLCVLDLTDTTGNNVKALEVFREEGFVNGGRHVWKAK